MGLAAVRLGRGRVRPGQGRDQIVGVAEHKEVDWWAWRHQERGRGRGRVGPGRCTERSGASRRAGVEVSDGAARPAGGMGRVQLFEIRLSRGRVVYSPGEPLAGTVRVCLGAPLPFRGGRGVPSGWARPGGVQVAAPAPRAEPGLPEAAAGGSEPRKIPSPLPPARGPCGLYTGSLAAGRVGWG